MATVDYAIGCDLSYRVKSPTAFVFNIEAAPHAGQIVRTETLAVTPERPVERWTMPESGNRYLRVMAEPGPLELAYRAEIALDPVLEAPEAVTEIAAGDLPLAVLTHLWPSRYCQADKLNRLAQRTFGGEPAGYRRVNAICNWIHDNVDYIGGISDEMTSAFDTATQRAGVCRDFAHLAIAMCRALGIPARYVSAYAHRLDPPDFHAVVEAYLQGPSGMGWYLFDPTRKAAPDGLVRIGIGRDAVRSGRVRQARGLDPGPERGPGGDHDAGGPGGALIRVRATALFRHPGSRDARARDPGTRSGQKVLGRPCDRLAPIRMTIKSIRMTIQVDPPDPA